MERHHVDFWKYHGTGNDFVMIDDRSHSFDVEDRQLIENMCHRRFGIGADGLILLRSHEEYDMEMIYFNADGRQSSMCGNGGRCIVAFAHHLGVIGNSCKFMAIDGMHEGKALEGGLISLKMNDVDAMEEYEGAYILNTGSPHFVKNEDELENDKFVGKARAIRNSDRFRKEGINVNFIKPVKGNALQMRTYERGVEDETYSCGTGVVAAAIVSDRMTPSGGEVRISTKGGDLTVTYSKAGEGKYENIWLTGPVAYVYKGRYPIK